MPETTVTVVREDGTAKEMSERQLRENIEPGDVVTAKTQGGDELVEGRVRRTGDYKLVIATESDSMKKVYWGDVASAKIYHPERIPKEGSA